MEQTDRNELKALIREVLQESLLETLDTLPPMQVTRDTPDGRGNGSVDNPLADGRRGNAMTSQV